MLAPGIAVLAAAVAYRPILGSYFFTDDWAWLFVFANWPLTSVIALPIGGHSLIARNLLFAGSYRLFGPEPAPFFVTVLLGHLANVFLLHRVARLATGSGAAALLAAVLWGTSPAYAETLAWYSASGQVFATTCALLVLARVLRRAAAGEDLTQSDLLRCVVLLFVGANFFGSGVVFAAAFPLILLLLPATRWWPTALAATGFLLLLYGINQFVNPSVIHTTPVLAIAVVVLLHLPGTAVTCGTLLLRVGLATLVAGAWWTPGEALDPFSTLLPGVVFLAGVGAMVVAPARRRALVVFTLLGVGTYAVIAAVRAPTGVMFFGFPPELCGLTQRLQYTGQAMLAVVVALVAASLWQWARLPRTARGVVVALWLGVVAAGGVLRPPAIDLHTTARVETARVLDTIRARVAEVAPGETVRIPDNGFQIFLPWAPKPVPGWAALFTIFFPSDEVDGRKVRFVMQRGDRIPWLPANSRLATVLVR